MKAKENEVSSLALLLRPLRSHLSTELADALMRLKADAQIQARYQQLASKNTEGTLTRAEKAELESLVRANSILTILKAEARLFLQQLQAA